MEEKQDSYKLPVSIVISAVIISAALMYHGGVGKTSYQKNEPARYRSDLLAENVELPINWVDIGKRMVEEGVIDRMKFKAVYAEEKELEEDINILLGEKEGELKVNEKNAHAVLNFLWAYGLSNKNEILQNGPMMDTRYGSPRSRDGETGGVENFASTGGWTLARGEAMDHYNKHRFILLTAEQQRLVEKVSKNIYRPCCDNPAYFPDCNHGMAMLGLLEILAADGASEPTLYKVALQMNKLWFPDHYAVIGQYLRNKGRDIDTADPKEILGRSYSSASGYGRIESQVIMPDKENGGGGSCSAQ